MYDRGVGKSKGKKTKGMDVKKGVDDSHNVHRELKKNISWEVYNKFNKKHTIQSIQTLIQSLWSNKRLCVSQIVQSGEYSTVITGLSSKLLKKDARIVLKVSNTSRQEQYPYMRVHQSGKYIYISFDIATLLGEGIIMLILNSILTISPHIVKCYDFSICDGGNDVLALEDVTNHSPKIMKNITHTLNKIHGFATLHNLNINSEFIDLILVQVLHTLYLLNSIFKLIHFDLHEDNIFIYKLSHNFNQKYKYFQYEINRDLSIYIANHGYILKLSDFGFTTISISNVVISSISKSDSGISITPAIWTTYPDKPYNFYPDYLEVLRGLFYVFGPISPILIKILENLGDLKTAILGTVKKFPERYNNLQNTPSAEKLLKTFFGDYYKKPKDCKQSNTFKIGYKI
jgi:hypothetical protein